MDLPYSEGKPERVREPSGRWQGRGDDLCNRPGSWVIYGSACRRQLDLGRCAICPWIGPLLD